MVQGMALQTTSRLRSPSNGAPRNDPGRPPATIPRTGGGRAPTVITADPAIADFVLAAGAAAGVDPVVAEGLDRLTAGPGGVVCVGIDRVEQVAPTGLPRDAVVLLLGRPEDESVLCQWSAPLGASVVLIPDGIRWLTQVLAGGAGSRATVVALAGGSGGVGTSTSALGLATAAARRGLRSLLIDLDSTGGGIDLLCGVEQDPGWRWPRLSSAEGFLGDLRGELPVSDEVELIAMGRGDEHVVPGPAAVAAVLRSAARSHDFIVADLGGGTDPGARQCRLLADRTVLVCGSGVRPVAAAGHWLQQSNEPAEHLLVRALKHSEVDAESASQILGVPCVGVIPDDAAIVVAQARGESPARAARRRWRSACDRALTELLPAMERVAAGPGEVSRPHRGAASSSRRRAA